MVWKHVSNITTRVDGGCKFSIFANGLHMVKATVLFDVFTDGPTPTPSEVLQNIGLQYSIDSGPSFQYMIGGNLAPTISSPFNDPHVNFYYTWDTSGMFNYVVPLIRDDLKCTPPQGDDGYCSQPSGGCNYDEKHSMSQDFYITAKSGFSISADKIKIRRAAGFDIDGREVSSYEVQPISVHQLRDDTTWYASQLEVCHGNSYAAYDQSQSYSDVPIGSGYYDITVSGRSVYDLYHIVFKNNPTYRIIKTIVKTGGQEVTIDNSANEVLSPSAGTPVYSYRTIDSDGKTHNINFLYIFPDHGPSVTISQYIKGIDHYGPKFSKQIDYSDAGGCAFNGGGSVTFGRFAFDKLDANILDTVLRVKQ